MSRNVLSSIFTCYNRKISSITRRLKPRKDRRDLIFNSVFDFKAVWTLKELNGPSIDEGNMFKG